MDGMVYTAAIEDFTYPAAEFDLFEIVAPADAVVKIHEINLGQHTEEGDAAAEMLKIELIKGHTSSGSVGSSITPTPHQTGFAAAGSTVEGANTTIASGGTPIFLFQGAWNVMIGFFWSPFRPIYLSPSERLVVRGQAAADVMTGNASMVFEELGG